MVSSDHTNRRSGGSRSVVLLGVLVVVCLFVSTTLRATVDTWQLRRGASRVLARLDSAVPVSVPLYIAPESEYTATWTVSPAVARRRLQRNFDFKPTVLSQLQYYTRGDETVYEVGNYVHHPDGQNGRWQLHVRLFPAPDGHTEVWAHWEPSVFSAPLAHYTGTRLDPKEGERRIRERIGPELVRSAARPGDGSP
ncbi:MAG: hypothetical protein PPP58_05220 [Natronomonas sp.]